MDKNKLRLAAKILVESNYTVAFTGAGISIESGIPPFRGEGGLWNSYNPEILDLETYLDFPEKSWSAIKSLFYDFFGQAKPNKAHFILAEMEQKGLLKEVITQNIDHLHQDAGSKLVHEFHGRSNYFVCIKCNTYYAVSDIRLTNQPPLCQKPTCKGLLKPDFVFFGEEIPKPAYDASLEAATRAQAFILIGTSGEIMPASSIPIIAKQKGCRMIEINPNTSRFTSTITDIHIPMTASKGLQLLMDEMRIFKNEKN